MSSVALNISDLISKFHTLEGNYLFEKQRSFGRYFTSAKGLLTTKEDQLSFINNLVPQSRTEELFLVQIFLYYKSIHELWNILFSEDLQLMAKIFKSKWFFKDGFADIAPDVLVMTVFPKLSYLLRIRILNKLNLYLGDEIKINLYFEAVLHHYGLIQASILFPSCSTDFILRQIKLHNFTLKDIDLLKLYKREPTFPEQYFHILKENGQPIHHYHLVMIHLALHDTERYWQLKQGFGLHTLLKRKPTARVMKLYKPLIMLNLRYYTSELNKKELIAHMNQSEFMLYFKEVLPAKLDDFSPSLVNNLESGLFEYLNKKLDKTLWLQIIKQTYYSAYNENFMDSAHLITAAILQLMPIDERSKYAEIKMVKDNCEQWICYYETERAIDIIKNRINLTTQIPQRTAYIRMLVTTCKINNDIAALLEVLKYFENRHKNDDIQLKTDFLMHLQQSFEIDKLSLDHIKVLLDIIKSFNVKHGSWFWGASSMLATIVKHHINNNLPIRDMLILYFKVERRRDVINLFNRSSKETKFILLNIADMIEDLSIATRSDNGDEWVFYACYVNSLIKWNTQNKKAQIPLQQFPFVAKFFKAIAGNIKYNSSLIKYIKATSYDQEMQNLLCDAYWKSISDDNKGITFNCLEIDWWFAKYKPHYIFDNAEFVLSTQYCNYSNFQKLVRNTDIYEKFGEKAVDIINTLTKIDKIPSDNNVNKYKKAIFILAYNPQYVNFVKPFFPPESGTINLDEDSTLYSLRTTIVQALESVRKPSSTLETLLLFLKGEYLHSSLSTLYKIAQNTPVYYLADFLRTLSNSAVSVRKHAIFLNATLMKTEAIYDMLATSGDKENNPSLRKFIVKRTLKYFLEDGKNNERFWHLLKVQVFLLNSDDIEGHQQLLVLNKIPLKYQSEFVTVLWQLFSQSQNKTVNDLRFNLLEAINKKLVPSLSDVLYDEMIRTILTKQYLFVQSSRIYEFIFNCFLYGDQSQISLRMDYVFEVFRDVLKDTDISNSSCREVVQDFILKCCTYLVYKKKEEHYAVLVNILEILRLKWSANFDCLVAFHQFLILNFTAIYFECSRIKFESVMFVQRFGVMFDNMIESFGESIIQLFSNIAGQFLRIICVAEDLDNHECLLHTLKALSMNQEKTSRLILVVNTLPINVAKPTVLKMLQISILDSLRMSTNNTVKVHLNNYLTKINNKFC